MFSKLDSIVHNPNGFTSLAGVVQTHHCEVQSMHTAGDHQVIIAKIVDSIKLNDPAVLYHHQRTYCSLDLFHPIKKSPTSWHANPSLSLALKPVVVLTMRKYDEPLGINIEK